MHQKRYVHRDLKEERNGHRVLRGKHGNHSIGCLKPRASLALRKVTKGPQKEAGSVFQPSFFSGELLNFVSAMVRVDQLGGLSLDMPE